MAGANSPPKELPATGGSPKWMWLQIKHDLKYTGGGVKKIRLMTEDGNVGISHVVITSIGKPPDDPAELSGWR
jgi:hypothetical protein